MAQIKTLIIFSYGGFRAGTINEELFWETVDVSTKNTGDRKPTIVINKDTIVKGRDRAFRRKARRMNLDIVETWAVDTCQMWLTGWGHIIDNHPKSERIVQLPGDLEYIDDDIAFFQKLNNFLETGNRSHIVIGDFSIKDRFGGKSLIDQYGTYPLLAIWFSELNKRIFELPLNRPRSEFLNIKKETLKVLLRDRKFAYEQTLNMLINAWNFKEHKWKYRIKSLDLGAIKDKVTERDYRGCLDQIERMERMLKQRWRELDEPPKSSPKYPKFIADYHINDHRSTSCRETAGITIRSLLGIRTSRYNF